MAPPGPLTGTQKTNVTAIETAINAAILSLTNPSDSAQANTRAVLRQMRRLLEQIKSERAQ